MKVIIKEMIEGNKWKVVKEHAVLNEFDGRATFNQLVAVKLESKTPVKITWSDEFYTYGVFTLY